jgi:hypothetical protein
VPTTPSDIRLLRRAIRDGWPVPQNVRRAIVGELAAELVPGFGLSDSRRVLSIARAFLAMDTADMRAGL